MDNNRLVGVCEEELHSASLIFKKVLPQTNVPETVRQSLRGN